MGDGETGQANIVFGPLPAGSKIVTTGNAAMVEGVIFDLDGTLVDSGLDFDRMRREMGLPQGVPILETLEAMEPAESARCWRILQQHEETGARGATLIPGVREFLDTLSQRALRRAVLTRNSRRLALATLERLGLEFDPIVTREDAPAKPDPTAVLSICAAWNVAVENVVVIGDFRYDIEAGNRAGARTILFTAGRAPHEVAGADAADSTLPSFDRAAELLGLA